jgi:hypothetical protein
MYEIYKVESVIEDYLDQLHAAGMVIVSADDVAALLKWAGATDHSPSFALRLAESVRP